MIKSEAFTNKSNPVCFGIYLWSHKRSIRTLPITSHHNDRLGFDSTPLETQILKLRGQWQADKDEKETFVHAKVRAPLQPESIPAIAEFAYGYQLCMLLCIACESSIVCGFILFQGGSLFLCFLCCWLPSERAALYVMNGQQQVVFSEGGGCDLKALL